MSALPFLLIAGAGAYAFVFLRGKARVEDATVGPEFLDISTSPGPTPPPATVRGPPGVPNVFDSKVRDIIAPMSTSASRFRIQPVITPPILF